jgi:hypothetical protein
MDHKSQYNTTSTLVDERQPIHLVSRQSPSPPNMHNTLSSTRLNVHRRRDSDTLRGTVGSPTVVDGPVIPARLSPSAKGVSGKGSATHRRSPTAPEPATNGNMATSARTSGDLQYVPAEDDRPPVPALERDRGRNQQLQQHASGQIQVIKGQPQMLVRYLYPLATPMFSS